MVGITSVTNLTRFFHTIEGRILRKVLAINACSLIVLFSINPELFFSQAIKVIAGIVIVVFVSKVFSETWFALAETGYICSLVMLVINLLGMGTIKRWASIGGFFIQFSEFAKIAMILMLAKTLATNRLNWLNLIKASLIVLLPALLIFKQPNLGTTLIFLTTGFSMIWMKGINKRVIVGAIILGCIAAPIVWSKMLPYQQARITAFLHKDADPKGSSYQTIQSIIAIGAGGLFGSNALHNKLGFVPENHTDFLFSCFAEHFGFIATLGLVVLIFITIFNLFDAANMIMDLRKRFFCLGFMMLLFMQTFMNIGMNIGILPVTGVVLPFFSYGGSSLLALFCALAIALTFIKYYRVN